MTKSLVVGSDYIGNLNAICPIRLRDPISDDVHVPGNPDVTSSDEKVAKAAIYNMMLMVRFEGVGECDIQVSDTLASGKVLSAPPIHVTVTQDPQPTEMDVDLDNVTWEPADTPH